MNVQRIENLRNFIESGAHPWGIDSTETCFIGQARAMGNPEGVPLGQFLGSLLENEVDLDLLTMPSGWQSHPGAFTRERAVETLDRLLQIGRVDWG